MPVTDPSSDRDLRQYTPQVSILIAARNEETTILSCLEAVTRLQYPPNRLEVLIGDDQSTDQTRSVVEAFIQHKPLFRLIEIATPMAGLRGKANVLAQLAKLARGEFLLFTDADTRVPPDWLKSTIPAFGAQTGIVTGVTLPDGPSLFHKLQTVDWLYNLTLTYLVSVMGLPVTGMGNNMAVTENAYRAVGGYESLPFSVVEDYTLFQAIQAKGYSFRNLLNEQVLARTQPVDTLRAFLHQRKRWMRGATALPLWMVIPLYCQYLAGPILLLLSLFSPVWAVSLYGVRVGIQTLVISFGASRLRQTNLGAYALPFELYQLIIGPLSVVFYLLPAKIEWKGRTYA